MKPYPVIHIICCALLCIFITTPLFAAKARYLPLRYEFTGITDKKIQANVNTTLENFRNTLHFPLTQRDLQHFYRKAPVFIKMAVEPYGYFRSQVQSQLIKTQKVWIARFFVTLGPPLRIKSTQIQIQGAGSTDPKFQEWETHLPFQVGQPLETEQYENAKLHLYNIATRRGYFDAKVVKKQIAINLKSYYATIIIIYDTGPRYRFGPTTFSETPFYDRFLKRFLTYHEGEYYDATKLEASQEGLLSSNYFNQVTPKVNTKNATPYTAPIRMELIPRKSKTYTLGLGYGTDTGIRGTVGLTLRQLGHEGHRFQTLLRASPKNSSLVAKYTIPGFNPAKDHFTIGAGLSNMEQSTGNANNAKFGVTYTYLSKHWKNSLALAYLNEHYNIANLPNTSTQLVYPTFDTKYINADNPKRLHKGISLEIQLAGADKNLLSQTSFFQSQLHLKTLYTIERTKTRLLFRSDYGYTNIANLNSLPLSLQLFAGGSRSVRGYGYNSIGPGRNLVVASTEIQQRVYGSFYLAGLVDAGVVANQDIFHHINVGTGPGLAWISTIGTIELTVANAFTQSNKPWSYQFTMGTPL
ncbi:MAG: hypothetical protein A3F13_03760 [Gammaproteobacteria bacterium RIFCSPHIGHO2_12_FULL_40_19]|nr:MAG: hypothetical protein A3F13_03760 [Gammaproteobacteria bacterium RIFCSPHIGHO2_12_FULL_40_19]